MVMQIHAVQELIHLQEAEEIIDSAAHIWRDLRSM
jgi:hypothetical protein